MRTSPTVACAVIAGLVCAAMMGWPAIAGAQQRAPQGAPQSAPQSVQQSGPVIQPEVRADVLAARTTADQLAAGAVGSIGDYLRLGGDIGTGLAGGDGRGMRLGARVDVYGRLHVDPLAKSRWAPYFVAGGSFRADERSRGRLYALAALGIEGPASHHVMPAFELGLGGGVRLGIAFRRAVENHR